jgi:hypothetical protein
MKRIKAYILTSIIVILFSSCEEKNNNSNYERIYFPENFELLNSNISNKDYIQKSKKFKFKIFTQINVSCATCIQKLAKWQNFIKQLDGCDSIYLIPVCKSKDKFELIKYLFESNKVGDLNFTLLLDTANTFGVLNKRYYDDMISESVLTNSEDQVLISGNPIENEIDRNKFLNSICTYK